MKISALCFLLFCFFLVNNDKTNHKLATRTNNKHNLESDSLYVTKDLPILVSDPCIENLLAAVIKSNSKYYNPGKSFYGLIFNNRKKYRYLEIFNDQWHDAKDTSYVAVIKLKKVMFLCSGDIKGNQLFHRITSSNIRVKLSITKKPSHIFTPNDPSLQGTFNTCIGLPIYIEVYTKNPIPGYKMHVRH
jgi:hypothetical protein